MFEVALLPRSLGAALRDVRHRRSGVRLAALRDLARFHEGAERETALRAAADVLSRDSEPGVRAEAATTLLELGAEEAVDELVNAGLDEHPRVQQMVLLALSELGRGGHPQARALVFRGLDSEAPALRFQAVVASPRLLERDELDQVLERTLRDPDSRVRHVALRVLEEGYFASDTDWRAECRRGLKRANESATVLPALLPEPIRSRLFECLRDADSRVALAATIVAMRLGHEPALERLAELLNAESLRFDAEDEGAAIDLAGLLGLQQSKPGLRRRAWSFFGHPFRWQARVALAALGDERAEGLILSGLRALSYDQRMLAVAAAGHARLRSALGVLGQMQGQPRQADPEAVADALHQIGEARS